MALPPAFFVGANLPWIRYGGDFGANAWAPAGLSQHPEPERIASLFETLRAHGVSTIRWFLLCDGRAGVRFGEDGLPDGFDDAVFRDVDTALVIGHWRYVSVASHSSPIKGGGSGWSTSSSGRC